MVHKSSNITGSQFLLLLLAILVNTAQCVYGGKYFNVFGETDTSFKSVKTKVTYDTYKTDYDLKS